MMHARSGGIVGDDPAIYAQAREPRATAKPPMISTWVEFMVDEDHKKRSQSGILHLPGATAGEANMKAAALDRRLSEIERKHPPRDRLHEKMERILSRCTDDELRWIIEITQKPDPFADPEIENTYWDIMSRHGWFDKPG